MGTRGTKPKPTHLKAITGNPGNRKLNDAEPSGGGDLGAPPPHWTLEQKAIWLEIVNASPAGVLQKSDRFLVELATRNLAQVRASGEITAAQSAELRRCLGEMGMTPSERSRLTVPQDKQKNPFADI